MRLIPFHKLSDAISFKLKVLLFALVVPFPEGDPGCTQFDHSVQVVSSVTDFSQFDAYVGALQQVIGVVGVAF